MVEYFLTGASQELIKLRHDGTRIGRTDAIGELVVALGRDTEVVAWLLEGYEMNEISSVVDVLSVILGEPVVFTERLDV